jgi:hypothetical protein
VERDAKHSKLPVNGIDEEIDLREYAHIRKLDAVDHTNKSNANLV